MCIPVGFGAMALSSAVRIRRGRVDSAPIRDPKVPRTERYRVELSAARVRTSATSSAPVPEDSSGSSSLHGSHEGRRHASHLKDSSQSDVVNESGQPVRNRGSTSQRATSGESDIVYRAKNFQVRKNRAVDEIVELTGEVVNEPTGRGNMKMVGDHGIEPGDPYEEGWVADTANDARARHWQTGNAQYRPVSWSDVNLGTGMFEPVYSGGRGGGGKEMPASSGGGGGGRGKGSQSATMFGEGGGSSGQVLIVYAFLVAVLGCFWVCIYFVVQKPEVMAKKVATFWSSQRWRVQLLHRNKTVQVAPRKETRYRTLCVYRKGYSQLARRLSAPLPAIDASQAEHTLDHHGSVGYQSMFLEMARPSISAHPIKLRKAKSSKHKSKTSSRLLGGSSSQRGVTLSFATSVGSHNSQTGMPGSRSLDAIGEAESAGQRIGGPVSSQDLFPVGWTAFDDVETQGSLKHEISLRRASGSLPCESSIEKLFTDSVSIDLETTEPVPYRRIRRSTWSFQGQEALQRPTPISRNATWGAFGEMYDGDEPSPETPALTPHAYREMQRHFATHVVPGSLRYSSLQRLSAHANARHDPGSPTEGPTPAHGGWLDASAGIKRTKSQPAVSVDEPCRPKHSVRRSASLHSIADALIAGRAEEA